MAEAAYVQPRRSAPSTTKVHCFGHENPLLKTLKPTASDTPTASELYFYIIEIKEI